MDEKNKGRELAILYTKKSTFTNDKGESVSYNQYYVDLGDKRFYLYPKTEKKELFNYLANIEIEKRDKGV